VLGEVWHVELSAIAVHPNARGQGLGTMITARLARAAITPGETPFLHVFPDNPALALYNRLGFRERARLWVLWCRPVPHRGQKVEETRPLLGGRGG
jgi:ribosomal protein S18 acetylase RimI-like enzyme